MMAAFREDTKIIKERKKNEKSNKIEAAKLSVCRNRNILVFVYCKFFCHRSRRLVNPVFVVTNFKLKKDT